MDGKPAQPDIRLFNEEWEHWRDGWYALVPLAANPGSVQVAMRHRRRRKGIPPAHSRRSGRAGAKRRWKTQRGILPFGAKSLTEHLAMALAANDPFAGLQFRAAAGIKIVSADHPPLLFLGQWACLHLLCDRDRDQEFVATGTSFSARFGGNTSWKAA